MTSEQRRYRVAVVGAAGMWGRNYLRAFAAHPRAEVVALVDRSRDRRQALADHYCVRQGFDDVEDLLAVEVPDIVSVILPVGISPQVVIACAEAGVRAISCEKPIAVRLEEADRTSGIIPRPYRLSGGDAVGWQESGYGGPPQAPA